MNEQNERTNKQNLVVRLLQQAVTTRRGQPDNRKSVFKNLTPNRDKADAIVNYTLYYLHSTHYRVRPTLIHYRRWADRNKEVILAVLPNAPEMRRAYTDAFLVKFAQTVYDEFNEHSTNADAYPILHRMIAEGQPTMGYLNKSRKRRRKK